MHSTLFYKSRSAISTSGKAVDLPVKSRLMTVKIFY